MRPADPRGIRRVLLRGAFSGNDRIVGMCNELHDRKDWLWTFTKVKGIEPTNNSAERALRRAVIYRKLSFGTQSASVQDDRRDTGPSPTRPDPSAVL
jgi:transposase